MLKDDLINHLALPSDYVPALEVERAEGIYLFGPKGEKWIDFISGICVNYVGHGHPKVVGAIQAQAEKYLHTHVYGESMMAPQVRYAKKIIDFLGEGLEQVYFTNSGTEAIEGALKVAKKYTGRTKLVSFYHAYHGSTHGSLSIGGNPSAKEGYGPLLPETELLHFNDVGELDQIDSNTAAVVLEIIQGAGGVVEGTPAFLQAVEDKCREVGALLIVDEIQTGFGRTGTLFAHQWAGIRPDILVVAKALGGGLPLGAFISSREILDVIRRDPPLGHITTFGGGPLAAAAGLAAFEVLLEEQLMERVSQLEDLLKLHLKHPAIKELRGKGLMYALLFEDKETAYEVQAACFERGLITIGFLSIDNGLRICPPLTITPKEIGEACQMIVEAIEAVVSNQ